MRRQLPLQEWGPLHRTNSHHQQLTAQLVTSVVTSVSSLAQHSRPITDGLPKLRSIALIIDTDNVDVITQAMQPIFPAAQRQPLHITVLSSTITAATSNAAAQIAARAAHWAGHTQDTCLWDPELSQQAARKLLKRFHCPHLRLQLTQEPRSFHLGPAHLGSLLTLDIKGISGDDNSFLWLDSAAATGVTRLTLVSVRLRAGGLPALQEVTITDNQEEPLLASTITSSQGITKWSHIASGTYVTMEAVAELAALPLQTLHVDSLMLRHSRRFDSLHALQVRGITSRVVRGYWAVRVVSCCCTLA